MFQSILFKQVLLLLGLFIHINRTFRIPSPPPMTLQENVCRKGFLEGGSHNVNDTQLLVALRGTSITSRPNSLPRHRTSQLLYLSSLLLCLASDIEVNPGPYTPKCPCNICQKAAKWGQQAIQCDGCDLWYHKSCLTMSTAEYDALTNTSVTWICCNCDLPNFERSLFSQSNIETRNSFSQLTYSSSGIGSPIAASSPTRHHTTSCRPTQRGVPQRRVISCISMNCNSLKSLGKIAEFQEIVTRKSPDLILACETKLSNDQATYSFLPPNYIAYRKDRNEHGGGVMLAHKDDFTLSQPPFLRYVTGESVWTRLHTESSKRPTYLCSCYIPNTHSAVTGLEHLRDTLSLIFSHHRHTQPLIYIAGDFNLGDIDWTNNVTTNPQTATYHQRLLDLMDEFGLNNIQHDISRPCSGKCLALILTNHPKSVITSNTDSGMSDHLLIDFTINCKPPKANKIAHKVYVFKKAEPEVIKSANNEISDQLIARNVSEITVHNNWSFFRDGIHKVMKNNIPSKMSKTRHNLPWVSTSIKREMRKRDRLLTQAKKSKKTEDWNKFKAQRNKIPKLIKHSRIHQLCYRKRTGQ